DLFPEGARPYFTGHQVRTVEAEAGRLGYEFRNTPVQVGAVQFAGCCLVGSNRATTFQPTAHRLRRGEVFHQSAYFGAIIEHGDQVTGYQEGTAISLVYGGQIEEIIIYAVFGTFG